MKTQVSFSQFCDSFGESYKDNFSYYGKQALYDYLEELEADTGEEIELDAVALCCDYAEYATALEATENYSFKAESKDKDEAEKEALEWLQDNTQIIPFHNDNPFMKGRTSGIIIQQF